MFFSIVIPSYNRKVPLKSLLKKLRTQKFTDFEIIVVDDGSTDGTASIMNVVDEQNEINYIYQINGGVSSARNTGATNARGEYLVFLDTDDDVTDNWLQDFHNSITNTLADVVTCTFRRIEPDGSESIMSFTKTEVFIPGSFTVRTSVFRRAGNYDPKVKFGENTELLFRLQELNSTFAHLDIPNFIYYPSVSGGRKNLQNKLESNLYVLEKHKRLFSERDRLRRNYEYTTAFTAAHLGQYKIARKFMLQAWKTGNFEAKIFLNYLFLLNRKIAAIRWKRYEPA